VVTTLPPIDGTPNILGELLRKQTFLDPDGSRHGDFRVRPDVAARPLDWEERQRLISQFDLGDETETYGLTEMAEGCTYRVDEQLVDVCCYAFGATKGTIIFRVVQSGRPVRLIINTDCKLSDSWLESPLHPH
jgi:hypothetical protein